MQKYQKQIIIGLLISLAIYIGMLVLFDSQGQFTQGVAEAMQNFPWWTLGIIALAQTGTFITRFLTWHYYMGVIGARDKFSIKDSAIIFITGFVMVVSPGKAAELLKAVLVKVKTGVPVSRTVPVILAERVNDGISVLILMAVTLLVAGEQLQLDPTTDALSRAIIFGSTLLIAGGLLAVQIRPLGNLILAIIADLPLLNRTHRWFTELYESAREVFNLRHVAVTMVFGVGTYAFTALVFILILWAFGLPLTMTLILQVTFISGIGSAIGALSFVPNGAGVTEISLAVMLMAIVAPSQPLMTVEIAGAAALLEGFFHKWYRVIVGLLVAFVFRDRLFTATTEAELEQAEQQPKHV